MSGANRVLRGRQEARPSLLYAIKQVELVVRAHLDELLKPSGVTALQYTALTVLQRRDGQSSSAELARNSFVTPQAMADLVSGLERRGLIRRDRDPNNRRRLLLSLTDAGRAVLADNEPAVRALEEQMVAELDLTEREAFGTYLNRCRAALATEPPH